MTLSHHFVKFTLVCSKYALCFITHLVVTEKKPQNSLLPYVVRFFFLSFFAIFLLSSLWQYLGKSFRNYLASLIFEEYQTTCIQHKKSSDMNDWWWIYFLVYCSNSGKFTLRNKTKVSFSRTWNVVKQLLLKASLLRRGSHWVFQ